MARICGNERFSWSKWLGEGAPKNTGWLMYRIDLPEGTMRQAYSYTRNEWITIPQAQNFFSTLLNLKLQRIPQNERKKGGS